eukprot:CAMPEP_0183408032 /NCGR_PEP_ID=MMETSP0370-20130417/17778_1 /TAXON_ID=268820 /ORGANISM="Peridinium aciculiferum, Strain PAER-2" /LENGTH=60 /DNA_ID=CAMNT_0025590461 /DNA_START=220 /DNA_END=402 /DNA_ORIENTATION=-
MAQLEGLGLVVRKAGLGSDLPAHDILGAQLLPIHDGAISRSKIHEENLAKPIPQQQSMRP